MNGHLKRHVEYVQSLANTARLALEYKPDAAPFVNIQSLQDTYIIAQAVHQYWNQPGFSKLRWELHTDHSLTDVDVKTLGLLNENMVVLQNTITHPNDNEFTRRDQLVNILKEIESLTHQTDHTKRAD